MNNSPKKVLFAGSFDPFTNGHLDIARRALLQFDELIIGVGANPNKKYIVDTPERCSVIASCFSEEESVSVLSFEGLTIDFCQKHNINAIIRGIRDAKDLSFEQPIALANRDMNPHIDTFFLLADPTLQFVSSSLCKEIYYYGGDISKYIPEPVYTSFCAHFQRKT
jgi:pantetheine-phosphate adenylyltransferase